MYIVQPVYGRKTSQILFVKKSPDTSQKFSRYIGDNENIAHTSQYYTIMIPLVVVMNCWGEDQMPIESTNQLHIVHFHMYV